MAIQKQNIDEKPLSPPKIETLCR